MKPSLMVWFSNCRMASPQFLKVRCDEQDAGYLLAASYPDGSQRLEQFDDARSLLEGRMRLQGELIRDGWQPCQQPPFQETRTSSSGSGTSRKHSSPGRVKQLRRVGKGLPNPPCLTRPKRPRPTRPIICTCYHDCCPGHSPMFGRSRDWGFRIRGWGRAAPGVCRAGGLRHRTDG